MSLASPPSWLLPPAGRAGPTAVRRRRVLLAGVGLFAVVGLLTYAILWLRPPRAAQVLVWTASYADTVVIPSNATGVAGATRMHEAARSGKSGHFRADPQPLRFTRGDFSRQLADLADFRGPSVVLVFAAHGGCDGQGAFLLPDDAGPDPADRVRLPTILDALAKLPKSCRKLVLFDATAAPSIPALGQFQNDFARGLAALDGRIANIPNLVVFNSTGPDQRSWPAVERGTTAFWHFARRGMQGDADGNRDGRLSAAEWVEFITSKTRDWAATHHAARQEPTVYPTGGEGDRRAADMGLSLVDGAAPADPLPTPFSPSPDWADAWTRFRELDAAEPHPTAFAPELWRDYSAWLLRYDQLAVLGVPGAATARLRVEQLRGQLLDRRAVPVTPQTLQLPFALGFPPSQDGPARDAVDALVLLPEAERAKGVVAALAKVGGDTIPNRLSLGRALVAWLADDPLPRLPLARVLLNVICEPLRLKPAEVHFVMNLADDLPPTTNATLAGPALQRVIRLRLRAEAVAGGSRGELVRPWIDPEIAAADAARRRSEDWLFVAGEHAWGQSGRFAADAEAGYTRAAEIANTVRLAEATWQTGIAELSALSEWLADGPRRAGLVDRMKAEDVLTRSRVVWAAVHELASLCRGEPEAARLAELPAKTRAAATAVAALRSAHSAAVAELLSRGAARENRAALADWWLAAESALSVPGGERRKELVTEFRRASRQLTVTDSTAADREPSPPEAVAQEVARDHARRRGLLHLARLGQPDAAAPPLAFQFDQFAKLADAVEMLTTASDQLAARFRSVAASAGNGTGSTEADRLARVSVLPTMADAANRLRRVRAAELLDWQAGRTVADYWAGADGTATPYYQRAANTLLADASALRAVPAIPVTSPDAFPFVLAAPAKRVLTDEREPQVTLRLEPLASPVFGAGVAAFWNAADRRLPYDTAVSAELRTPVPPRTDPLPDAPTVELSAVAVTGYFRGRDVRREIVIERHPVPHITAVRRPLGKDASVAVRADTALAARYGSGTGALHFVLDATGSMRADPNVPGDRGRFAVACDALEAVLKAVPVGVSVAVSAFGHRTATNRPDGFETLLDFTAWPVDPAKQTAEVMARLRALEPWAESPVVRAVLRAKATLAGRAGALAVILLGDAVDTTFSDDATANPKKQSVKDAIRAAFSSDTAALHVVANPVSDPGEKAKQEQFRVVTECKPAGLFLAPGQTAELTKWIRAATAARIKVGLTGDAERRDLLTGTEDGDNWLTPTISPGNYTVRTVLATPVEQRIDLRPGERLLLSLAEEKPSPRFARPNAIAETPAVSRGTAGAWTAAVTRQRLLDAGGFELSLGVDRAGHSAGTLTPTRVADTWFDLAPLVPRPVAVRWASAPGWPAPTWQLTTKSWPKTGILGSPAKASVWWAEIPFPAAATWTPEPPASLVGHSPVTVNGTTIESVTVEEHEVEVAPGETAKRECLVVRLAFTPSETVIARPLGSTATGDESRVYQSAGKATCLFWWAEANRAKAVTGVEFVNVSAAKKAAISLALPPLPPAGPAAPQPTPAPR